MNYSCAGNLHTNLLILKRVPFSQPGKKKAWLFWCPTFWPKLPCKKWYGVFLGIDSGQTHSITKRTWNSWVQGKGVFPMLQLITCRISNCRVSRAYCCSILFSLAPWCLWGLPHRTERPLDKEWTSCKGLQSHQHPQAQSGLIPRRKHCR